MNSSLSKNLLLGFFSLFSITSHAACTSYYCDDVYVERLYPNNVTSGATYVGTTGDESQMSACTAVGGVYFRLDMTTEGGKVVYATLLAAFAADKKVQVVAVNGSSNCDIAYVLLDRQ